MRIRGPYILTIVAIPAMLLLADCVVAQEPFPNVNDAEGHLYTALDALHQAPSDFRGHKAEAILLIRNAISELEIAKQVAN
jgi:hypothetical protein